MPITHGTTEQQPSAYQQALARLEASEDTDKGSLGAINSLNEAMAHDIRQGVRSEIQQTAFEERKVNALRESERVLEEEVDKIIASDPDTYEDLRKAAILMAHQEYNTDPEMEAARKSIAEEAKALSREDLRKLASKQFEALTKGRKKHVNAAGMDTEASGTSATAAGEAAKADITDESQLTEAQRELFYGKMRDYRQIGWERAGAISKAGFKDEAGARAHALKVSAGKFKK